MIIDFHTHIFPEKIAAATVAALAKKGEIPAYSDGREEGLYAALRSAGVELAVNLPVLTRASQFDSVLSFAEQINKKRSDTGEGVKGENRLISFAGAHPAMDGIDEKMALIKERGFLGVKLHPDYQGTYFDDEGYVRIVTSAKKYGLIVVTHAGYDVGFPDEPIKCTPDRVLRLLDRVGGYSRLVLAHMGGNRLTEEVYTKLCGEDVYFDTAYVLDYMDAETFARFLEKHGDERVLFATDSPWQDIPENVEKLRSFGIGRQSEEKIFSGNALRLLGI